MAPLGLPATEKFRKVKHGSASVSAGWSCHMYVLKFQVMRQTSVLRVKKVQCYAHFWHSSHVRSPVLLQASQVASEDVAAGCAQAVQAATAGCNTHQQALICQTACHQLTQCCQQLHSTAPLDPSYADPPSHPAQTDDVRNTHDAESIQCQVQGAIESRQVSTNSVDIPSGDGMLPRLHSTQQVTQLLAQSALVSAAAVTALRPGVLPGDQMKPMLDCLIRLAMGVSQNSIQQAAMTAAAALVNKWPAGVL